MNLIYVEYVDDDGVLRGMYVREIRVWSKGVNQDPDLSLKAGDDEPNR